jgi:hypothetical protein
MGRDFTIFRSLGQNPSLRTEPHDSRWLNGETLVGTLGGGCPPPIGKVPQNEGATLKSLHVSTIIPEPEAQRQRQAGVFEPMGLGARIC